MMIARRKLRRKAVCSVLAALLAMAWSAQHADAAEGASQQTVDRKNFPEALGILTSERLMFPVDLADWPLRIDRTRQLFVDDFLIARREGLTRQYHQAVKHPQNPLVVADLPWEGKEIIVVQVRRDAEGRFRMWYVSRLRYQEPGGKQVRRPTLYAESDDGIHWRKPQLGLLEYNGSKQNNFVIHAGDICGLFEHPKSDDPQRRFTALVWHEPPYVDREGYFIYTSPDGLRWKGDLSRLIIPNLQSGYGIPQQGIGDTSIFRYDGRLGRFVCDAKFVLPGVVRCRGMAESDDLVHWTPPRFTIYMDEHDEPDSQIYGHISFPYESMWLGLVRVMHTQRVGFKQTEIELTYSRDGRHWSRPSQRQQFLPLDGADEWDPDYTDIVHNGPLLVGDELWFYYRGSRSRYRDKVANYTMSTGLARLRRDGFVSLDAGPEGGTLLTRPLTFSGQALYVNADVNDGGSIRVAVCDERGQPIDGYGLEDSIAVTGDHTRAAHTWRKHKAIALSSSGHVRLQFAVQDAKLYSFWIE